jgi:hypothetical protein
MVRSALVTLLLAIEATACVDTAIVRCDFRDIGPDIRPIGWMRRPSGITL